MYPAAIDHYLRPDTLEQALAAVVQHADDDAVFIAGGQSLMQAMKSRMLRPRCVIDLQALSELRGITRAGPELRIGAMTRYCEIAEDTSLDGAFSALRDAATHVGDRQVRNRGTIGGSVCWNYMASCMPAVNLALNAGLELRSAARGAREVKADDFFFGPLETAREDDELLVELRFQAGKRLGSAYSKWGLVQDALPVVGVCVAVTLDDSDRCADVRIAISGLSAGCQRGAAGEASLLDSDGSSQAIARAMDAIATSLETHSDASATAEYRRQLIRTIGQEVAERAFARARAA